MILPRSGGLHPSGPESCSEGDLRDRLTPRELEIARLVANGLTNKEIARALDISHWTVATHLRRISSKLEVKRRTELGVSVLMLAGPWSGDPVPPARRAEPEKARKAG